MNAGARPVLSKTKVVLRNNASVVSASFLITSRVMQRVLLRWLNFTDFCPDHALLPTCLTRGKRRDNLVESQPRLCCTSSLPRPGTTDFNNPRHT